MERKPSMVGRADSRRQEGRTINKNCVLTCVSMFCFALHSLLRFVVCLLFFCFVLFCFVSLLRKAVFFLREMWGIE